MLGAGALHEVVLHVALYIVLTEHRPWVTVGERRAVLDGAPLATEPVHRFRRDARPNQLRVLLGNEQSHRLATAKNAAR